MTLGVSRLGDAGWESVPAFQIRGKWGKPVGLGAMLLGYNAFGDRSLYAGIYQKRYMKQGIGFVKMRHYRPTNSRKPAQQAWRAVFAAGMAAWSALDPVSRETYTIKGYRANLDGRSAFLREYLRAAA